MKKMPLIFISLLIMIVLITGMKSSSPHSDHGNAYNHHDVLSEYSSYVEVNDQEGPDAPADKPSSSRDEKSFLENNVGESSEMASHLNETVSKLKEEGNDVEELEAMINEYSLLVSQAQDYLSQADNSSSSSDEQKYQDLSREKIIQANTKLNDIFREIQSYLPGPLSLTDNETVNASGSGIAIISGNMSLDLSISEGKLTIVDFAGDLRLNEEELNGSEIKSQQLVVPETNTMHQMLSYDDVKGNVSLSGSVITVAIMSNNVTFNASGTGKIELYGNGTYTVSGSGQDNGTWIPPVFDMR